MKKNIWNAVGFQLTWWSLVLSAAKGVDPLGWAVAVSFLVFHAVVIVPSDQRKYQFTLIGVVSFLGWGAENIFHWSGIVQFADLNRAPIWLLLMWLAFSTTLHHSLKTILHRPHFAALAGAVFGPISYLAGIPFELLSFPSKTVGILSYGVFWGCGLFLCSKWIK